MIRAVLFDVGGPVDTEEVSEPLHDACIREASAALGLAVDDDTYAAANAFAIDSFAWNTYAAIVWKLCAGDEDLAPQVFERYRDLLASHERGSLFTLRPGIAGLLEELSRRGLLLGIAANQPKAAIGHLERHGIARWFTYREVSGDHGYFKPDPRLFIRACDALGVTPDACVMVGDRVDNDIVPARRLGMGTILFRTGRHEAQQPRSWDETPDVEVRTVEELREAIGTFC